MTMMTLILIYPHAKGYPNGIVITVIIVTEKTVLLVLADVRINVPPKSVGFGDSYMPQRLVCFVVRMVKNDDQTQKSIQGKPKKIISERTWQYGIHSQTGREQLFNRCISWV